MADILRQRFGEKRRILINYMDPVMGAHGGPAFWRFSSKGSFGRNSSHTCPRSFSFESPKEKIEKIKYSRRSS